MNVDNLSLKSLRPIVSLAKRFRFILFLGMFALIYGYLLLTINQLTTATPAAADLDSETATVKRLRVDEAAVQSMLRLEEENIDIQALFEEARNNPFAE